jgi:hypothetical protein
VRQQFYNAKSEFLAVNASLRRLNNVNCLFLTFLLFKSDYTVIVQKVDWLAACIALRVVGAVWVVFLWSWRKICTILQPM